MKTWIRFETPHDREIGPTLGPFDWIRMADGELRCSPDDEPIAHLVGPTDGECYHEWEIAREAWPETGNRFVWSDFVVYHAEKPEILGEGGPPYDAATATGMYDD